MEEGDMDPDLYSDEEDDQIDMSLLKAQIDSGIKTMSQRNSY